MTHFMQQIDTDTTWFIFAVLVAVYDPPRKVRRSRYAPIERPVNGAPLPEDVVFIGQKRRCATCNTSTPMFWIPDEFWRRYVPLEHQHKHLCFSDFLAYVRIDPRTLLP